MMEYRKTASRFLREYLSWFVDRGSELIESRSRRNTNLRGTTSLLRKSRGLHTASWGGSVDKPMPHACWDVLSSKHRSGQTEDEMGSGYAPEETTNWSAHGKMELAGKARKAIEAQGEERPLGPGLFRKVFIKEVGTSAGLQVQSRTGKVRGGRSNSRLD